MVQSPVGTGPYVFREHVSDDHIALDANPNYWGGTPMYKEVIFKIIPDDTARVAALEAGEVDIATFLPGSAASRIEENPNLKLVTHASLRQFATHFATYNPKAVPLRDVKVRTALNYAIDKAGMCEKLFGGRCTPMDGQYLSYLHLGYNPNLKMFPYDPELAKKLLAEAGYPNGFEVDYTYTNGRYPQDKQAGEAIASYLRAVGLTVNENAVDYAEWARQFDNKQSTALYTVGFNFGLDGYLSLSSYLPDQRFRTSIMPAAFDEAILAASKTMDLAARVKLLQDAEAAINKEPFAIYLYSLDDLYGVQNWVEGFQARSDQTIRLIDWAIIK
jgi:peptide/nickel transport system substrate-binding protein